MTTVEEHREAVKQLVEAFVNVWEGADYGPAHIALSDYNLLDEDIRFCITLCGDLLFNRASTQDKETYKDHSHDEIDATCQFLNVLSFLPEEWRDIHAEFEDDDE